MKKFSISFHLTMALMFYVCAYELYKSVSIFSIADKGILIGFTIIMLASSFQMFVHLLTAIESLTEYFENNKTIT